MAKEFPNADVVGMDLVPPTPLPYVKPLDGEGNVLISLTLAQRSKSLPMNCRFEIDDVNLDLSHYAKVRESWVIGSKSCD